MAKTSCYIITCVLLCLICADFIAFASKPFILRVRKPDGSIQRVSFASEEEAREKTLRQVLEKQQEQHEDGDKDIQFPCSVQFGSTSICLVEQQQEEEKMQGGSQTLESLGIQHGSILTIVPATTTEKTVKGMQQQQQQQQQEKSKSIKGLDQKVHQWNPFPELAKDYESALRQIRRRKTSFNHLSFKDLSNLHRAMHTVEAQPNGRLHRLYLCSISAERFAEAALKEQMTNNNPTPEQQQQQQLPRVALLLGTIHRERKDKNKSRRKTSLSSTTHSEEYCQVAKVQAIWEPKQLASSPFHYDVSTELLSYAQNDKVMKLADWLGLIPVGWMYSYTEDRHGNGKGNHDDDNQALPVWGHDVQTGALLQISFMKKLLEEKGAGNTIGNSKDDHNESFKGFCTVAMHAPSGTTEVFQLSDVAVQMVAENMLVLQEKEEDFKISSTKHSNTLTDNSHASGGDGNDGMRKKKVMSNLSTLQEQAKSERIVRTRHPVLIEGLETTQLDSVLCLVNTALLSHSGTFVGQSGSGVKKSNSLQLTRKMRKLLARAVQEAMNSNVDHKKDGSNNKDGNPHKTILELLCNFNVLLALFDDLHDEIMMKTLVETVRKFANGFKKGTQLDTKILQRLDRVLSSAD